MSTRTIDPCGSHSELWTSRILSYSPTEFKCQHFPVWSPADSLRCVQRVSRGYSPQLFKRFLKTKDSWRRKNRSLPGHDYKWQLVLQLLSRSLEKVVHPAPPRREQGGREGEPEKWNSLHEFIGKQTIVAAIVRSLCRKACSFGTTIWRI